MFRTLDIILVVVMTAVAAVTYTIKHQAELKLEEVHKIEAEIKLERDTIDLLRADWALLTQPSRLTRLIDTYKTELQLAPTESTQLVQPSELPMLKAELPVFDPADADKDGKVSTKEAKAHEKKMAEAARLEAEKIITGSVTSQ
jgi:hypothetical protein